MSENIVIVGAGISGLTYALVKASQGLGSKIKIIERSDSPGGLLKNIEYGGFGVFDCGMHNFLQTGIVELDNLLLNILEKDEWNYLIAEKRDLAGAYCNGYLQKYSPYFDIENMESELNDVIRHELMEKVNSFQNENNYLNAKEYFTHRFGGTTAQFVFNPIVSKVFHCPADELDESACYLMPLSRVVVGDDNFNKDILNDVRARGLIAWREQRTLPAERSSGRFAYYPKRYGIGYYIKRLKEFLESLGVEFYFNSEVEKISVENSEVCKVYLRSSEKSFQISDCRAFVWTSNIPELCRHLNFKLDKIQNPKMITTILVNFLIREQPSIMGDLYYIYCYDPTMKTFRVTNYTNYCSEARRDAGFPISVELIVEKGWDALNDPIETATKELLLMGILKERSDICFSASEILPGGFPCLSSENVAYIDQARNQVYNAKISNLIMAGISSERNLFFQTDVLIDTYRKAML